ncbi:MAG: hypothetical protein ACOCRX_09140 [Candidatus Woesearchaeota archaeon]
MTKRLTYTYVENYIKKQGDELLDKDYKNNHTPLRIRGSQGHVFTKKFNEYKAGKRCKYCRKENYIPYNKYSYEDVKNYIELFTGYKLLSTEYKNSKDKLEVKCPQNHIFYVSFHDFKRGTRCRYCSVENNSSNLRNNYQYVKDYFSYFNYQLLSKSYKNKDEILNKKCPEGHEYKVRFGNFKKGHRCPICKGNVKFQYKEVKDYIE